MYKNPYPGKFFVFEGLDGSGKTTQAKNLFDFLLLEQKIKCFLTKEPTEYSEFGRITRRALKGEIRLEPLVLQQNFIADRNRHLNDWILPSLQDGFCVVCDRYFLSTVAYGGIDLDMNLLLEMNRSFIYPDFIFFLDVGADEYLRRKGMVETLELFEKKEKLTKVYDNYIKLIAELDSVYLIQSSLSREGALGAIKSIIKDKSDEEIKQYIERTETKYELNSN